MNNCPFQKIIKSMNGLKAERAYHFLEALDDAIVAADDVIDRKDLPESALVILFHLHSVTLVVMEHPGLYKKVREHYESLMVGEKVDLEFVPGKALNEDELLQWARRGNRASIAFACLCYVDESFDTEENWKCVKNWQTAGLALNDCSDILNEEWEDFIQGRRNFVALKMFDPSIYSTWRERKSELIDAAKKVRDEIRFQEPSDKRLQPIFEEIQKMR